MTVVRPNACKRFLAATLAAAGALQPLTVEAAAILETLAEVPIQGLNPVSRTSCSRWTTPAAWAGISFPTTSVGWPPVSRTVAMAVSVAVRRRRREADTRSANTILPCGARVTTASSTMLPRRTGQARRRTAPIFPAKVRIATCGCAVDLRLQQWILRLSRRQHWRHHRSHHCVPGQRLVLEDEPDHGGEADRRFQRLGVPPQRSGLQCGDRQRKHDAGHRRRVQLPQRIGHVLGRREVQVRQRLRSQRQSVYYTISQVQFCSAKDAAGWGTTPCSSQWDPTTYRYVRYGTGAGTFDPQGLHACRHQVGGIPRQRVDRGQSQRSHVCAGNDQFRPTGIRSTARGYSR
jgi:hypothetical protein